MKKNPSWNDIENIYELIGYVIYLIKNNFWKFVILFLALGISIAGFNCDFKNLTFSKESIKIKELKK